MEKKHMQKYIILFVGIALFAGCGTSSSRTAQISPAAATDINMGLVHDPANPPIDCPLRKQGINPQDMKPFADTQKYVEFLERSDRAAWQKPDTIINELHLLGTETIADVGAGSGYFSFRFARALPKGKVFAIDIEPEMLRHIYHKAMAEGVDNIEVIKADFDDPHVPAGADMVFVCDVIHHVKERQVWLKKLSAEMKEGAKLVVIEFKEGDLPEGPPAKLKIPKSQLTDMIEENKFTLDLDKSELLPYQVFLIFSKT
jgi:SAM-dependent methyltransferase